jgi:hypothetical protein
MNRPETSFSSNLTPCPVAPAQAQALARFCREMVAFCRGNTVVSPDAARDALEVLGALARSPGGAAFPGGWRALRLPATPQTGTTLLARNASGDELLLQLDYAGQAHIGSWALYDAGRIVQVAAVFDLRPRDGKWVLRLNYEGQIAEVPLETAVPGKLVWTQQPQYPKDMASDELIETNKFPDFVNLTPLILQALGFVMDAAVLPSVGDSQTSGPPATSKPEEAPESEPSTVITGPIWRLDCLAGPHVGKSFPLLEKLTIGRSNQADLRLDNERVSRQHAELYFASGHWWLKDLNSGNGTFVKGAFVHEPIRLSDGDEIRIGDSLFRVRGLGKR